METEARNALIIKLSKQVIAVVSVILFIMTYRWVLIFGINYPQQGNVVLAILMGIAFIVALILFVTIRPTSRFYDWKWKQHVEVSTCLTFFVLCMWHLAAVLNVSNVEIQTAFMYTPVTILGFVAGISLIVLFMHVADKNREEKRQR